MTSPSTKSSTALNEAHDVHHSPNIAEPHPGAHPMPAKAGTDKTKLLTAQIWVADIATQFADMNAVWDAWVLEGHTPARACVQAALAREDLKVEIAVIAAEK